MEKNSYFCKNFNIETDAKDPNWPKMTLLLKLHTFGQSLWHLIRMTISWVANIALILAWLDKDCGIFTYGQILSQFRIFLHQSLHWNNQFEFIVARVAGGRYKLYEMTRNFLFDFYNATCWQNSWGHANFARVQ